MRSGTGQYTRSLAHGLVELFPDDEFVFLISNHKQLEDFPLTGDNVRVIISAAELNDADMERDILPAELNAVTPDLVYFPFFILPEGITSPSITTILDLTFVHHPQFHLAGNVQYLQGYLDNVLANASRITTISHYVRNDVLSYAAANYIDLDADRVAAYDASDIDLPLALVGLERWLPDEYRIAMKNLRAKDRVRILGFVPDDDLPALYQGSLGVLYPSLSEGFGYPVAEAYASNVPILTSNNSSMKEIGTAAMLTDPENIETVRDDLITFAKNRNLREELVRRGAIEAKKYSENRCAERLYAEFTKAVSEY